MAENFILGVHVYRCRRRYFYVKGNNEKMILWQNSQRAVILKYPLWGKLPLPSYSFLIS